MQSFCVPWTSGEINRIVSAKGYLARTLLRREGLCTLPSISTSSSALTFPNYDRCFPDSKALMASTLCRTDQTSSAELVALGS